MSIRSLERMLKERDQEICRCHQETIRVHNYWFEVFEDMQKEHLREIKKLQAEKKALEQRALKAERECDKLYDKKKELLHKLYDVLTQLEDEKGKHQKLTAQINRDYENSSIPSSKAVQRKKITNSREKTGRKPGGQPGHKGHCRRKQEPTQPVIFLPPPEEVLEDSTFKKTAKTIVKQMVNIRMVLDVTEYHADVYYNSQTGERVHAVHPLIRAGDFCLT